MPLLEIDDDVYQYLLRRALRIGEDGSSILRRELGLPHPNGTGASGKESAPEGAPIPPEVQAIRDFLTSPQFANERIVTKKYLRLLAFLAKAHPEEFERVLEVRGRQRLYFGNSRAEIAQTGKSLHPRNIPGTDYWAMTNADTAQKQDIAAEVMKVLGYPREVIQEVRRALN
jgi:negative modulator of initiation of replication